MIKEWLDFTVTAASAALAFVFLFEGVRLLRSRGYSRIPLLMTLFGVIYFFALAGFSYWIHSAIKESQEFLKKTNVVEVSLEKWGMELAPDKREEGTRALARMVFVDSGKLVDYIELTGQRKRFSPTEQDIKDRDFLVVTMARLDDAVIENLRKAIVLVIWAIVAGVLGFVFGSKSTPANPTIEAGARESRARRSS